MPLTAIVTIILRIYALQWLVNGIVQGIAVFVRDHERFGISGTPFFAFDMSVAWLVLGVLVFLFSHPIARIVVPPPNSQINVGTLNRSDLYCFALTFLGLTFFLSSFAETINGLHYYLVTVHATPSDSPQSSDAFYRLTRPALTLAAGLATLLLAAKLAHKLLKVHRDSPSPPVHPGEQAGSSVENQ